jgi:hypothetical protein
VKTVPDINAALRKLFDRWWLIPVAGVATLLIFYQLVLELTKGMPRLGVMHSAPAGKDSIPLGQIEQLSGAGFWTGPLEPLIPLPPPVAPPAPPTTMKVAFTYQGFFETSDGFKLAYVKVADKQVMGTNGGPVTADYVIAGFDLKAMTVHNATRTNVLKFNTPTELEVPLK